MIPPWILRNRKKPYTSSHITPLLDDEAKTQELSDWAKFI